jgi:dihydrolipoamide dehydrogenase
VNGSPGSITADAGSVEVVDAVVVGAGSGGLTVAVGLARLGRRVALVERAEIGGDCTNTGCIPSKCLLEGAAALPPSPSPASVALLLERVRRTRAAVRHEALLASLPRLTLLRGAARLEPRPAGSRRAPDVVVEGTGDPLRLRSRHVVIAAGAEPRLVDVPGLPQELRRTTDDVFDLRAPPEALAVLGGGAAGVELALAFVRLGSRVAVVERLPRLLPRHDPGASELVRRSLERLGVTVHTGADAVRWHDGCLELRDATGAHVSEPATEVLMVVGRQPRTGGLGLEALGLPGAGAPLVTDGQHRTGVRGLWAIGDVTGRVATTHAANLQGRRLVRRLALPLPLLPEGAYPSVVFSQPEVAQIGPSAEELERRYPPALLFSHRVELADTDRGRTLGLEEGYLRLSAMRLTGRLLAATLVAPGASELLTLLTLAQRRRMSLWQLSRLVAPYPTLSAALRTAADAFVFETLPHLPRELLHYLRHRVRRPSSP